MQTLCFCPITTLQSPKPMCPALTFCHLIVLKYLIIPSHGTPLYLSFISSYYPNSTSLSASSLFLTTIASLLQLPLCSDPHPLLLLSSFLLPDMRSLLSFCSAHRWYCLENKEKLNNDGSCQDPEVN